MSAIQPTSFCSRASANLQGPEKNQIITKLVGGSVLTAASFINSFCEPFFNNAASSLGLLIAGCVVGVIGLLLLANGVEHLNKPQTPAKDEEKQIIPLAQKIEETTEEDEVDLDATVKTMVSLAEKMHEVTAEDEEEVVATPPTPTTCQKITSFICNHPIQTAMYTAGALAGAYGLYAVLGSVTEAVSILRAI